jgi:hypothetical protein
MIIGNISGLDVEITESEMKELYREVMGASADLMAYHVAPYQTFIYLLKCKRLIESQQAIIRHLDAKNSNT